MKRIIALLLAIMMLPIFSVVSQAAGPVATMSEQEFKEVLLGNQTTPEENAYNADLIRAYRNVSVDQLNAMRIYHDNMGVSVVSGVTSPDTSVISNEEAQILAYGFIKLMTFPNAKNGTVIEPNTSDNRISDADISRAAATFYTDVTIGATTAKPADILNKLTCDIQADRDNNKGYMTKNALGAFVIDLQKNLRRQAKDNISGFLSAYATSGAAAYVNAIVPYVEKAAADALTTPAGDWLGVATDAMVRNGMVTVTGTTVNTTSPFIQFLVDTIEALRDNNAEVAAVVMNTIMSGVIDAVVEVYSGISGTKLATVEPNNQVATLSVGNSVYLKVVSNELAKLTEHGSTEDSLNFNPSLSPSLDAAVTDTSDNFKNYVQVVREGNMLKVTGMNAGSGILKLYRNTDAQFDFNNATKHNFATNNAKELFMELNINVIPRAPIGGGGGGSTPRVEAPTITFEIDGDKNITVTLETATKDATIYYTTDGTTPTKNSQKYEGPFQVEDGTTIKAFAVKNGYIDSYVTTDKIDLQEGLTPTLTGEHIAYVHGRDTGNFDAEDNVTRGEVAAIFSRLIAKKMVFKDNSTSKFTDVVEGAWHTPYIKYLSNVNIINGYEDGTFKPDAPITRAEFATIASRFFELETGAENTFADVLDTHWAKTYIDSAVVKGWLKGYEDGTFKPDQAIKRSEAVTIVNRMLNRSADKEYIKANYDEVLDYPDIDESHWAYYEILEASNWHDHQYQNNEESWTDIFYQERFNAS